MTPHWTDHRSALQLWLTSSPRILLACDFDGTLAPIVAHAAEAKLPAATRRVLERLVGLPGVMVAIISGRSLADLRERVGVKQALYAGNHGFELLALNGVAAIAPCAGQGHARLREALEPLETLLARVPGVWIENKHWTASVHYRQAAEEHHALIGEIVNTALRDIEELTLRQGKCIWEIRPSVNWDKGTALLWFMEQCGIPNGAVAFFGDDITDCDAFAVVVDGWTGVVGDLGAAKARMRLRDSEDITSLLEWMADVRVTAF